MRLRRAVPLDSLAMGQIHVDANLTDTLSAFLCRDVDKYPLSHLRAATRFVKRRTSAVGAVSFVVETEQADYPADQQSKAPEVVAYAVWLRAGTSKVAQEWQKNNNFGWSGSLNRALHSIEDYYLRVFPTTNCTVVKERLDELLPYSREKFDEEIFSEAWILDLLFVDPNWQRRGLGRKMIQWGFDRAHEEKVPVLVKSTSLGGPVYKRLGFRMIGEMELNKLFDTLEYGGIEPAFWVWEPASCEGMYFDRARAAFINKRQGKEVA